MSMYKRRRLEAIENETPIDFFSKELMNYKEQFLYLTLLIDCYVGSFLPGYICSCRWE